MLSRAGRGIGQEGWGSIKPNATFTHGGEAGVVPCQDSQCIVGDAGTRPQKDQRDGLVRDLPIPPLHRATPGTKEAQAAIFNFKSPAIKIEQAMSKIMGYAGCFKTKATRQHDRSTL
jgi:hypothetical protein